MKRIFSAVSLTVIVSTLAVLTGCGEKTANAQAPAGGKPPTEVAVIKVAPERVAISNELPGRLEATRVAEVRARVPGIVLERVFKEGSDVKAGQVLFRIDPGPYQATLNSTQAAIAKAEANLAQANSKLQRYKPLVETKAISQQEYDEVMTTQKQAAADLEAAKAARDTAKLNLGYATVKAPISGRIGRALVTEGALVGQGEATPLAQIQQLDPIYATLTQSTAEFLRLQQALASGKLKSLGKDQAKVTLLMEDGSTYPHTGKLLFSDLNVDQSSGSVSLRAEFPNPQRLLLPGMFVRARLEQAVTDNAILVPQQAVQRTPAGATVLVVGEDGKVRSQPIQTTSAQGNNWIVSEGLKAGDVVIVEGLQKAKPGAEVKTVPWQGQGSQPASPASGKSDASSQAPAASNDSGTKAK